MIWWPSVQRKGESINIEHSPLTRSQQESRPSSSIFIIKHFTPKKNNTRLPSSLLLVMTIIIKIKIITPSIHWVSSRSSFNPTYQTATGRIPKIHTHKYKPFEYKVLNVLCQKDPFFPFIHFSTEKYPVAIFIMIVTSSFAPFLYPTYL